MCARAWHQQYWHWVYIKPVISGRSSKWWSAYAHRTTLQQRHLRGIAWLLRHRATAPTWLVWIAHLYTIPLRLSLCVDKLCFAQGIVIFNTWNIRAHGLHYLKYVYILIKRIIWRMTDCFLSHILDKKADTWSNNLLCHSTCQYVNIVYTSAYCLGASSTT